MKIKTQLKLTYKLKDVKRKSGQVDKEICRIMKKIGAKWYAQGFETETGIRDICFDLEFSIKE